MKRSTERILTTHAGSLARPEELVGRVGQAAVTRRGRPPGEPATLETLKLAAAWHEALALTTASTESAGGLLLLRGVFQLHAVPLVRVAVGKAAARVVSSRAGGISPPAPNSWSASPLQIA